MNEVWNLDVIYRGFDAPAFAADMEKLEKLVQDYVAFAGELGKQTPLDGLKKGVALEESLSELSGKLVEYAFLRQSGNTRDAEAGCRRAGAVAGVGVENPRFDDACGQRRDAEGLHLPV